MSQESRSELTTSDTRVEELAVIVHEGREFSAGGFSVDLEAGRMIAYVTEDKTHPEGFPYEKPLVWLTTWAGERSVTLARTGKSRGFYGATLEHFYTRRPVAGFYWYGKGLGSGMMLRLRKGRKV